MSNRLQYSFLAFATCFAMHLTAAQNQPVVPIAEPARSADWQVINDDVMGGISTSQIRVSTNGTLVFEGTVSLENNGGFASVRSVPVLCDLTGCDAFVVRVRGDGRRYKFTVRTERRLDSAIYQAEFVTKAGEWQEHRLAFKEFVPTFRGRVLSGRPLLDPAKIASVGFLISDKQAGPFRLEIDWIKGLRPTGRGQQDPR
ncbi:MAG TPA: CIA30 family protein [Candidatus Paceibacterota bacterium]|nr:CIA30 family protein [Candidatus Paceibacterota bacterium]HRZ58559.1 CIA30 family protein [Candidatus Paceibacterota bacterium]